MKPAWRYRHWSLRMKIAALLIAASLLPLGAAALRDIAGAREQLRQQSEALLAARADQLVADLDGFHRGFQRSADQLRRLPDVVAFCHSQTQDPADPLLTTLDNWPASDAAIRGVALLDPHGRVRIATEPVLVGRDLSKTRHVRAALQGEALISDLYVSSPETGSEPTIAYLAPVRGSQSEVIGLAALWVRARALWDIARASNGLAGPGSFAVLFDEHGVRIAHTYNQGDVFHPAGPLDPKLARELIAEQRFGSETAKHLADVKPFPEQFTRSRAERPNTNIFHGFGTVNNSSNEGVARRLATVPWTVFYMIPESSHDAPIARLTRDRLAFGVIVIVAALLAGALLAATILKPVSLLTKATEAIASGDRSARVEVEGGDELGRLAANFNTMAERVESQASALERARVELEQRVATRTAELLETTKSLEREIATRTRTADALRESEQALRVSEDQLRQSQKLEAIGRLAGGVAHDFNNLLTVVLSYADLVSSRLPADAPMRSELEEIKKAGLRAADLTRQMLAFSRQQLLEPKVLDLNGVLHTVHKMLARVLGEDVELKLVLDPSLAAIKADPGQMEQVLMNLVVNARDAMPHGGKLTLQTANVQVTPEYAAQLPDVAPGAYVVLTVSDTGIGMDKATRERAFEPFFTTKDRGKGSGLGLSTVFGIVKQSGGSIWLYSEPNVGTTFKLYFPEVRETLSVTALEPVRAPLKTGHETILLVEDDDQVRSVSKAILERSGYRVLAASGPLEALAICERDAVCIDLLLTDMIMPKLNGQKLAEKVTSLRPGLKTIFMSGYTDDVILNHAVMDNGAVFVQKPIMPDALVRKVREVLDSEQDSTGIARA